MIYLNKEADYRFDLLLEYSEEEHIHQDTELIYVLNGMANVRIGSETYHLADEDILVINMNKSHSLLLGTGTLACRVQIPYSVLNRYIKQDFIMFWCNSTVDNNEYCTNLRLCLRQMLDCLTKQGEVRSPMLSSYFYEMLNSLCEHFLVESGNERFEQDQNKYDQRMNEVIAFIEANYAQHISLNDLADRLHLTYSYLSRYFKKTFGMNFLEYINNVRLHHAVEDLLYTDKPITRVAIDNGFVNSSGLNRSFREKYDMAPSAYKKTLRGKLFQDSVESGQLFQGSTLCQQAMEYLAGKAVQHRELRSVRHVSVRADGSRKEEYTKNWMQLINIGRASDLLKAKVQEQILYLRDQLGFRYVRFWNPFSEDMELRREHQTDLLNFDRMDEVLDFLVYNNLIPFIECGDKPDRIDYTTTESVKMEEGNPIFWNLKEFRAVMTQFIHHVITRYRENEVRKWYFECWDDDRFDRQVEPVSYFEIFNTICDVIRSIIPGVPVGGCGMKCNDRNMEEFLTAWKAQPHQPDFFSIMTFPYEHSTRKSRYTYYTRLSTNDRFQPQGLQRTKELLQKVGMDIPVFITEWNCTISSRNYVNDSCYKGAYLLHNIIDVLGETDMLGYWAGSDLVSTYYDSNKVLNGCPGLLTKDNICKPAYYAFRFLHRMGPYLVDCGNNYLITTSGHFSYYIVCCNYHSLNYQYFQKSENLHTLREVSALSERDAPMRMSFQLDNLPKEKYYIKISRINHSSGSVLNEWLRLNAMEHMRKEDINYLKRICTPHMSLQTADVENGTLSFDLEMEPEEITLVHIYRQY